MAILSDEFYYQPIRIDTINTRVYADLLAKEGDANGRGLLVTLTENGLMKDTTGITLILKWEHTSVGNQGLDNFEAVDPSKGLYKITYPTEMLNRGKVRAFIRIIDSGKLAGTRNIEITVDRGVGDDTAIASSDSFSALASALIEVQSWNMRIDDVEQDFIDRANNLDATYPTRLVSVEQQLAETVPHVDTTEKKKVIDSFHKMISDSLDGLAQTTYIMVGDSTRASNGAWIFKYVSENLKKFNVDTYLSAQSGLKAEHWSTYTANLQPGYPTVANVIALIPGTGTNTMLDICIGINDAFTKTAAETELYIKHGIDLILASKPDTLINITSPNRLSDSAVVEKLNTVYKNLSESYGYGFTDVLNNVFKEWNATVKADYFVDDTHPAELGQRKMAEYIISKLIIQYKSVKKTLGTGVISPAKYKKIATITITEQYYGVYGTFFVKAIPGNLLKNSSCMLDFNITQSAAMGSDAVKAASLSIVTNEASTLDFSPNSFIIRTRELSASKTIIDIYMKNITSGNRNYELFYIGGVNTDGTQSQILLADNSAQLTVLGTQATGTTDAAPTYGYDKFFGSPDGSLWKVSIGNNGVLATVKKS